MGNSVIHTDEHKKPDSSPAPRSEWVSVKGEMLRAGTRCGQAATAWPSVMAWLVFHSDTTAGSTRLLGSQGDQNIEYGTAAASLAPSTAEERLPPSLPAPLPLACEERRKKKEEQTPPNDSEIPDIQRPLIHLREGTLAPLFAVLQVVSRMPECPWVPSPCTAPFLTCMLVPRECNPGTNCDGGPAAGTLRSSSACYHANTIPGRSNKSPSTSHGLEQLPGSAPAVGPSLVLLSPSTVKPPAHVCEMETALAGLTAWCPTLNLEPLLADTNRNPQRLSFSQGNVADLTLQGHG